MLSWTSVEYHQYKFLTEKSNVKNVVLTFVLKLNLSERGMSVYVCVYVHT